MNRPTNIPPPQISTRLAVALGFTTNAALFGLGYVFPSDAQDRHLLPFVLAISVIPLVAIVLSILRATRKFGLGMLLGCGAIWLVMLTLCGGGFLTS